jgi:esterase/lipase superfamily enzyme
VKETADMLIVTDRAWDRAAGSFSGRQATEQRLSYVRIADGEGASSGPLERFQGPAFRRLLLDGLKEVVKVHPRPVIVVPIHGYNQEWGQAVEFFRQVDAAITAKVEGGVTVGFSWASAGDLVNYLGDRSRARASAVAFSSAISQALRILQDERCPSEIVVVAHSMGNYMLCKAAEYASEMHGDPAFNVFSEALMVAPDVDGGAFETGGAAVPLARLCRRITVYRSVHWGGRGQITSTGCRRTSSSWMPPRGRRRSPASRLTVTTSATRL